MIEHTPEPWTLMNDGPHNCRILSGSHPASPTVALIPTERYISAGESLTAEQALANARRIVTCVNACRGISTEFLEKIAHDINTPERERNETKVV